MCAMPVKVQDESIHTVKPGKAHPGALLYHPNACATQEEAETLQGYQTLLEHIIVNGRVPELLVRKFARQIGSALAYCHYNNVVHRNLKIENILVSQDGVHVIKITDFEFSTLYDPLGQLATFCGTSYFPAPEMIARKPYIGPEVDIWGFGLVLYILVCGRVPFDGPDLTSIHAKVRSGSLKFPSRLSAECKDLLSHMLATNPGSRASLPQVLSHPWMVREYSGPPEMHIPTRDPLHPDKLDREVIHNMMPLLGPQFSGDVDEIEAQLVAVLNSRRYTLTTESSMARESNNTFGYWNEKQDGLSGSLYSLPLDPETTSEIDGTLSGSHCFGAFGLQLRSRLFPGSCSRPTLPVYVEDKSDALCGFHPLVSMYYLANEKMARCA
ncbi:kinase-like domain-containing protein [Mycena sp. CBHHK59/15]|nr:kinase-like domain-containing protein [Mycena sp. CBHHK59/15]